MRQYIWIVRGLLGAAALATMIGCEDEVIPKSGSVTKVEVTMPRPSPSPSPAPFAVKIAPAIVAAAVDGGTKIEVMPEESTAYVDDARRALELGELDRALKLARVAVKKEPQKSAAWNTLGRVQLRRGFHKDATVAFQRAVETNPRSSYARNNLGLVYLYDGKYQEAAEELEQAVELRPVEGYMWNNLGMAYEHLDLLEDARDAYRQAVAADVKIAKKNLARLQGVESIRTAHTVIDEEHIDIQD